MKAAVLVAAMALFSTASLLICVGDHPQMVSAAQPDSASGGNPAVRADMLKMIDTASGAVAAVMDEDGFGPFGVAVSGAGKVSLSAFDPGQGPNAPSDTVQMIEFGKQSLSGLAKKSGLRAVAIVYDGRVRNPDGSMLYPDAVFVLIDHKDAPGAVLYDLPYKKTKRADGKYTVEFLGDVHVRSADRFAFGP